MNDEELRVFLPSYLSSDSERILIDNLKDFPDNIDDRMYTDYLKGEKVIYQGDGLIDLVVVRLPEKEMRETTCMVLSNTCDISSDNKRLFNSQIVYAPIINLQKYSDLLTGRGIEKSKVEDHIVSIRKQQLTQVLYLPQKEGVLDESIVFFDQVNSSDMKAIDLNDLEKRRTFTLSNYGSYMFLFKLSVHFTRIQDKVDRQKSSNQGDSISDLVEV